MADSRGASTTGWWLNHADEVFAYSEQRSVGTWVATITADASQTVLRAQRPITITKAAFIPDSAFQVGTMALTNAGTAGTATGTLASYTVHSTLTAFLEQTLTLAATPTAAVGEVLAFKRTTTGGSATQGGGLVYIEYYLTAIGT